MPKGQNSASAWDVFNILINISEVLRQIFTCGIDSSTSGNPTPGEVINDVAVLSPLPDISIVNIWIVKCLVGHVIIGWPIAMQTWDLSKNLHDLIFEPEIVHTKVCKLGLFSVNSVYSHLMSVNLELLRKFCKKRRYFLEKFTQLAKILHDRRSRRSWQISTL